MNITIENYILESSEHGGFNLIELKKYKDQKTNDFKIQRSVIGYGLTLPRAVKRIIENNLHQNPNIVNLRQYLVDYRNEVKKIEKLFDLEKLKQ